MHLKCNSLVTRGLFNPKGRVVKVMVQTVRSCSSNGEDSSRFSLSRQFSQQAVPQAVTNLPPLSMTDWFSDQISNASLSSLSDKTLHRSKRMILDTLGVGYIGSRTDITQSIIQWGCDSGLLFTDDHIGRGHIGSIIWGSNGRRASPAMAAYINGISIHSMDFDDTWHPATHPSGPVLPTVLALAETLTGDYKPSGEDITVAYNVGVQFQGLLMQCSKQARDIPCRFHPPAVVGVMGSAAACARLLGFGPMKTRHAIAIAASFAGAPMANAGTKTKPLHCGKSARFGLEAALMADYGVEGNENILDMQSGFGAFYDDYDPDEFMRNNCHRENYVLHDQDIAIKRFPAHLGMHWAIDAAMEARSEIAGVGLDLDPRIISRIIILAPKSRYINRPLPSSEHEARHSFQFNVCSAILDGEVKPESFFQGSLDRPLLQDLLQKTKIITPEDNEASFEKMYVGVSVQLQDGSVVEGRCDTPYGHWRKPLSDTHLQDKFLSNTKQLNKDKAEEIIRIVGGLETSSIASDLNELLAY